MLRLRLQRVGRKHEPSFRLVATDSHNSTKSGRFKEILGFYDPRHRGADSRKSGGSLNADRVRYWLSQGASPTDTVNNLLIKLGVIRGKKVDVSSVSKKVVEAPKEPEVVPTEGLTEETELTPEVAEGVVETDPPEVAEEVKENISEENVIVEETPAEPTEEKPDSKDTTEAGA